MLSDVRMCEKYKIYYPYSIGPIVYKMMPELRGGQCSCGLFPIFLTGPVKVMAFYKFWKAGFETRFLVLSIKKQFLRNK